MAKTKKRKERQRVSARQWAEQQESGGGSNSIAIPEWVIWFSPDDKQTYRLDFLSYKTGKGNPNMQTPGVPYFERTFYTHRGIGVNEETFVCPAKTAGKRCPICEATKRSDDPDLAKSLAPKKRQMWLLYNLEEPDQLLLWDVSYYLFGEMLKDRVIASDEEDGYDFFADNEDGMTLKVAFKKKSFAGSNFYDTASIDFVPRKTKYGDEIVDELPCLDELLIVKPYDKLKSIFLQIEEGEDGEEVDTDDGGEDEDVYEEPVTKRRQPAKSLDEEEAPWDGDGDDDEEVEEESKPKKRKTKPKPAATKSAKTKPKSKPVEANGDGGDDDEDWVDEDAPDEEKPVAAGVDDSDDDEDWDADWDE